MTQYVTDNKTAGSTVEQSNLVVVAVPGADAPIVVEADRTRHTASKTLIWMSESESDMIDLVVTERDVEARSPAARAVLTGDPDNVSEVHEDAHSGEGQVMTDGGRVEAPGVSLRELVDEAPSPDDYVFEAPVQVSVGDRVIDATRSGNPVGTVEARERPGYQITPAHTDRVINFDIEGERVVRTGDPQSTPLLPAWVKCDSTGRVALIGFNVTRHDAATMDCPVCGADDSCKGGGR